MATIIKFIKKLLRKSKKRDSSIDSQYVVPRNKHQISKTDININALKVINRLHGAGFEAYLVGGSVRDLLLRKAPKDFDISTNAKPNEIKKLFRNARIIGRRFKLVHILFHRDIIEVATFRGKEMADAQLCANERGMLIRDNVYGSLEEDAWRRDFTINSLYYHVKDSSIIDYTGGFDDVNARTIRIIGDPDVRYHEDPVRMLRALRFSAKLEFALAEKTSMPIKRLGYLITHVSSSRLFDEMVKLYHCGAALSVHDLLIQHELFPKLFPKTSEAYTSEYPVKSFINIALQNTDTRIKDNKPVTPAFLFAVMLWFPLRKKAKDLQQEGYEPLPAVEKAMSAVIVEQNKIISIPKRFSQIMREIWILQYRFPKRTGKRAFLLLQHSRFRAAYDFLALRALAGDEDIALASWWTNFQDASIDEQDALIAALNNNDKKKTKKK